MTLQKLTNFRYESFKQPLYSLDISPTEHHFFQVSGHFKFYHKDKSNDLDEDILGPEKKPESNIFSKK